jgi:thiol-disulfide isomerase/thioredoxin
MRPIQSLSPAALAAAILAAVCALVSAGCGPTNKVIETTAATPSDDLASTPPDPRLHLLAVGAVAPRIEAEGWVNGSPPKPGGREARLVVVDLWADWCPMCRLSAPGLVRTYKKFKSRGVAFVSVTDLPESMVSDFVEQFGVCWPAGFGATAQTIEDFGVRRPDQSATGLDIAPALYLIGANGRVLWCDGAARYRHVDTRLVMSELEAHIEKALAEVDVGG